MYRVLISDPLAQEGLDILQRSGSIELDMRSGLKGDELRAVLGEVDGVIVRSGTTLTKELLEGQTRLKVIVRAGVGVDNIDVPAASHEGIVVMNTPGGNTLSTAEQTIALLLAMCRHTAAADAKLRSGVWDRKSYVGSQLAGRTLGVVGLGRVGLAVAKRALGLEMKVVGYDPFFTDAKAKELGIRKAQTLAELYPVVDILTVHVPLNDETRGLIGKEQIAMLPKGAFVLNCARGGIVDESALLEALESKHLAGAGLDVFENEPLKDSPFLAMPNVVLTPHLGASTTEAQLNVAVEAAQLITDFLLHGNVRFAVNMMSLEPGELEDVRRSLDIAYRLGLLQAQWATGTIRRAMIQYRGEVARKKTKLITASFTAGLLQSALEEHLNVINAPLIAEERGIHITEEVSTEGSDFATLIHTEVETDSETHVAAGTTRGRNYNRLVRIGPYRIDAYLEGTMMIYHHRDKPGLIGFVGAELGRHDVNIGQMIVGRQEPGGDAIGVLALDHVPPDEALENIRKDPRVASVQIVTLPLQEEQPNLFG